MSVIVPVHGDRGGLARTLDCLEAQETARSFEVVVVDNGDNERLTSVLAPHRRARVVVETRPGSYQARNAGVLAADATVLAFTDADCLPGPEWLEQGARALEDAGPGAFVGGCVHVVVEGERAPSTAELWQLGYDLRQETYVRERGWAVTANLFVRRTDFDRAGPFATGLESGGDREWGERATGRGMTAVYSPAASLRHPARPTMAQLNAKVRRITRGAVARERSGGAVAHPGGWWRAARPILRSSWLRSASVSPRLTTRVRFVAVALWVHYYRLVYGLLLLHGADGHRRTAVTKTSVTTTSEVPPGTTPLPTISVAMINRDYGRYLAEAIDSALAQEPRPLEVVVVDDGSTDSSAEVLASYGEEVTSIVTPARGKGAATNEAVAACRGDVVALLDSDDLMLPGRLSALARAYAADPQAQWVWHRLAHVQRDTREPLDGAGLRGFTAGHHDHRAAVARGRLPITTPATSALSWRRPFLAALLPLPARVRSQDNYLKFLTLGLAPGVVVDEVLSLQGLHGDNAYTTASGRDRAVKQVLRAIDVAPGLHRNGLAALHRRTVAEALVNSGATAALDLEDRRALLEQVRRAGPRLAPWLFVATARRARQVVLAR